MFYQGSGFGRVSLLGLHPCSWMIKANRLHIHGIVRPSPPKLCGRLFCEKLRFFCFLLRKKWAFVASDMYLLLFLA